METMDLYQIVFHVGNILALINLNDEPLFYCQYKTWRFQFILNISDFVLSVIKQTDV